jgi:hypothetical protein
MLRNEASYHVDSKAYKILRYAQNDSWFSTILTSPTYPHPK